MNRTLDAEEKILLAQSAKERAEIVDKYDRGGKGVDIDPWEDPTYEVYHVTDRYGFIHDKRLPEVMSTVEMKAKQTEIERKQKWVKMCSKWDQSYGSDKFFKRLYKGLPEAIRGLVWSKILKLNDVKKENEGVYEDMKQKARRWCPDIRQIDLDVNRTYRNHIMFRKRYDVKQQSLFHVLAAYSMYNTEVGYCQGMSQIAAIMLMYMNEEDAFWAMSELLTNDRHAMHGFFIPGFPKLIRFQDHHDKILKKFLPRVKKHLTRNDMYTPLYTIKWYMQCFLDRVPFPLAMRLWDIYIYEGERLLVAMSYNIIKMHKKRIMQLDMDHLMSFFQVGLVTDFGYHGDKVIESLIECAEDLRKAKMDLPPPSTDISLEKPTKPFGVFEIPDLDQVIINIRKSEKLESVVEGSEKLKSTDKMNRPSIPPDGGPVLIPSPALRRMTLQKAIEETSSLMDETLTIDEMSSKASYTDNRSSDVESVDTSVAGDIGSSLLNLPDNPFLPLAAAASSNAKKHLPTNLNIYTNTVSSDATNILRVHSQTSDQSLHNDSNQNPSNSFAKAMFFSTPPTSSKPLASHFFPYKLENTDQIEKSKTSLDEQSFTKSSSLSEDKFSKLEKDLDDAFEELNKNLNELNLNKDISPVNKNKSRPYSANIPKNHLAILSKFGSMKSTNDDNATKIGTLIEASTEKTEVSTEPNDEVNVSTKLTCQSNLMMDLLKKNESPGDEIIIRNDINKENITEATPSQPDDVLSLFFKKPNTTETDILIEPQNATDGVDNSMKNIPLLSNSMSEGSLKSAKPVHAPNSVRTSRIPMTKNISMKTSPPIKLVNHVKSPNTSAVELPNPILATGKIKPPSIFMPQKQSNYSFSHPPQRIAKHSTQIVEKSTSNKSDETVGKNSAKASESNTPKTPLSGSGLMGSENFMVSAKDNTTIKDNENFNPLINSIPNAEPRTKLPTQNPTHPTSNKSSKLSKIPPKPPTRNYKTKLATLSLNKPLKTDPETTGNESKLKLPTVQKKPSKSIPITVRTHSK